MVSTSNTTDSSSWLERKRYERGRRALERQLDYQRKKAESSKTTEDEMARFQFLRSQMIRKRLENVKPINATDRVLEVGSGTSGLIFGFGNNLRVGVDPLAAHYKLLYPKLQSTASTLGESANSEESYFKKVFFKNGTFELLGERLA